MFPGYAVEDARIFFNHSINLQLNKLAETSQAAARLLAIPVMLLELASIAIFRLAALIDNLARSFIHLVASIKGRQNYSASQALTHLANVFIFTALIPLSCALTVVGLALMIFSPIEHTNRLLEPSNKFLDTLKEAAKLKSFLQAETIYLLDILKDQNCTCDINKELLANIVYALSRRDVFDEVYAKRINWISCLIEFTTQCIDENLKLTSRTDLKKLREKSTLYLETLSLVRSQRHSIFF